MRKTKKSYEEYLNSIYDFHSCRDATEYLWSSKVEARQRNKVLKLGLQCKYGTILRTYDPIAFEVGYNEYKLN